MVCCAGAVWYTVSFYRNYIVGVFHTFPEPVAKELRKALYYSNWSVEPQNAVKYYNRSLQVAAELGMDPYSDEVMGIKIKLAEFLEKIQLYQKAIYVLDIVRTDNINWVEVAGNKPGNEANRSRILKKTVAISVKLGELYANVYVNDKESAEARLIWAFETAMKEQQRREREGVKEEEGDWLSPEEIGGSVEGVPFQNPENSREFTNTLNSTGSQL
jgi:hypothetical protein